MNSGGMMVDMSEFKVVVGSCWRLIWRAVGWPYGVCAGSVDGSEVQCTSCQRWVLRRCDGIGVQGWHVHSG